MAYRSSGTDNHSMVGNLKRFGVISSLSVEEGFRHVDRKFFVPKGYKRLAHTDQPIKEGNVHISAPHIYGAVMEALELPRNTSLTFLNAGSGTGYLTCIAASILGPKSSHFCVDIHADVIEHCKEAIENWKTDYPDAQAIQDINIIHGNALDLNTQIGECALGFDRIYIGAAIETYRLPFFKTLLKPGGILVGPVDSDLVKITRLEASVNHPTEGLQEYREELLSPVRFAPLATTPRMETVIPTRVWSPTLHRYYPESFRQSCKALLLCSQSNYKQQVKVVPQPTEQLNVAAMLPRAVWLEIMSYTHRDWFEAPLSEVQILRRRLQEEKENTERANRARLEADARCRVAEKERDVYKMLAIRWKRQHEPSSNRHNDDLENVEEAAATLMAGSRNSFPALRFGRLFGRFRAASSEESEEDESEDEDAEVHDIDEELPDLDETEMMDEDETNEGSEQASLNSA